MDDMSRFMFRRHTLMTATTGLAIREALCAQDESGAAVSACRVATDVEAVARRQ